MDYLLDTHTLIWFLDGDNNLSAKARRAIESPDSLNFVSIASLWEIAIKISLKRLDLKAPFEKIEEEVMNNGFKMLPITFQDTVIISTLPFHHRDPFDRILIAQSINHNLIVISKDQNFDNYAIKVLW